MRCYVVSALKFCVDVTAIIDDTCAFVNRDISGAFDSCRELVNENSCLHK